MAIDKNFTSEQGFQVGNTVIKSLLSLSVNTQIYTSNGTYTKNPNLIYAEIIIIGAGGSSLSATNNGGSTSAGGSGGATVYKRLVNSLIRSTEPFVVGIAVSNNSGTNSSFGNSSSSFTQLVAGAGTTPLNIATNGNISESVSGGTGSGGDLNIPGGDSDTGHVSSTDIIAGRGGDSQYGHGGGSIVVITAREPGNPGSGYGAGGGGPCNGGGPGGSSFVSGIGSNGVVIITEYYSS